VGDDSGRILHDDNPFRKPIFRAAALGKRDALSDEQRAAAAQAMASARWPFEIAPGTVVSVYSPIRNEIDRRRDAAPRPARRKAGVPVVLARGKSLVFRAWSPTPADVGPLGIPEPSPAAAAVIPDIMLVPLAGVRPSGHRIGYGAGITTTRWSICARPRRAAHRHRLADAGNKSGSGPAARRGAGLCANGKKVFDSGAEICVSCLS